MSADLSAYLIRSIADKVAFDKPRPSSREREVDDLRLHQGGEGHFPDQPDALCLRGHPERLLRLAEPPGLQSPAAGHSLSRANPHHNTPL